MAESSGERDDSDSEESDSGSDTQLIEAQKSREREAADSSFRINCFSVVLDCLLTQVRTRFEDSKLISQRFSFLWDFSLDESDSKEAAVALQLLYNEDLTENFLNEFSLLNRSKTIFLKPNSSYISPLDLLNKIYNLEMQSILPEVCVALRMFLCLPVTVAEGERSFSSLSFLKNSLRSTMSQDRLNSLALIAIEEEIVSQTNYDEIIDNFANQAARRKPF